MTSSALPLTASLSSTDRPSAELLPIDPARHTDIAETLAGIAPWSTLGISADALERYFGGEDASTRRYAIHSDGNIAGVASIRHPWLKGPYIELLAVFPDFQHKGLGTAFLDFIEADAMRLGSRNIWVCTSQFNEHAVHFYNKHGFKSAAALSDLVADGFTELLLRKTLT